MAATAAGAGRHGPPVRRRADGADQRRPGDVAHGGRPAHAAAEHVRASPADRERARDVQRARPRSAGSRCACRSAPGVPEELYEDPGRLRQVLINLLSNAVKFAASGEVRVTAEMRQDAGEAQLRLAVRDRGPVIPEADARPSVRAVLPPRAAERRRAAGNRPRPDDLPASRRTDGRRDRLQRLDGGRPRRQATSSGSRCRSVRFRAMPRRPPPRPDAPARRSLPRTRILLVEDILANQLVTATLLRREGHLVDIASNGAEAISAVAGRPYDLVFMDIFMPGMSGLTRRGASAAMGGPAASRADRRPDRECLPGGPGAVRRGRDERHAGQAGGAGGTARRDRAACLAAPIRSHHPSRCRGDRAIPLRDRQFCRPPGWTSCARRCRPTRWPA